MQLLDRYFIEFTNLISKVKETQKDRIIEAGELIAQSVASGGAVHIYDTGHIINHELIERGGGLLLYKPFKYTLNIENPVRTRALGNKERSMEGLAEYALRASNALPGDVMIIGSVSGKSVEAVDLALHAKKMGMHLIAITSLVYSSEVPSDHSCGKRLFELADVVLDNCAPAAEALMEVEGLEPRICAASGISAAFIMWSVTTVVIESLMNQGITPSVFKSHNFFGGPTFNETQRMKYQEQGY